MIFKEKIKGEWGMDNRTSGEKTLDMIGEIKKQHGNEKTLRMCAYMNAVLMANEHINLTAITDKCEFIEKHILDSLMCFDMAEFQKADKIVDLGTGAGFPGIPLAIAAPEKQFVLVDSLAKKLNVIKELTDEMGIHNIKTLHIRAEDMGQSREYREKFDLCLSRAVANLQVLAEWSLPLVRVGGNVICYKGQKAKAEAKEAGKAIKVLGGKLNRIDETSPNEENMSEHALVVIRKSAHTPAKYPRKPGLAKKTPIGSK